MATAMCLLLEVSCLTMCWVSKSFVTLMQELLTNVTGQNCKNDYHPCCLPLLSSTQGRIKGTCCNFTNNQSLSQNLSLKFIKYFCNGNLSPGALSLSNTRSHIANPSSLTMQIPDQDSTNCGFLASGMGGSGDRERKRERECHQQVLKMVICTTQG